MKTYLCECGKEFINPQSFNGHKSNCITHLIAVGKVESKQEWLAMKHAQNKASIAKHNINNKIKADKQALQWIEEKHVCETCGKVMTEKYGSGRFCSRSCANKFSSNKVKKHPMTNNLDKLKLLNHNRYLDRLNSYNECPNKCLICGQVLPYSKRNRKLCGSKACHAEYMSIVQKKAYDEGRRTGWVYHNEISYPEKYFITVFDEHNIDYEFQVPLFNGHSTYHLDFVINGNIDFEVDGLQHYREDYWIEHDKYRDEFVKSKGYKIYRFKWSNPKNKEEMQIKINELLEWIKLP